MAVEATAVRGLVVGVENVRGEEEEELLLVLGVCTFFRVLNLDRF